jgi:hypothetical protein
MKKVLYVSQHPYLASTEGTITYNILQSLKAFDIYVVCYAITPNANYFVIDRKIDYKNVVVYQSDNKMENFIQCVKLCTPDSIYISGTLNNNVQYLKACEFYECAKISIVNAYYEYFKPALVSYLNSTCNKVFTYNNLQLGASAQNKVTKKEACEKLQIDSNFTYVFNICNNKKSRSRYDIFVKSVVLFFSKYENEITQSVKFIVATHVNNYFNLFEIFVNECKKQNLNLKFTDIFVVVQDPHTLSDEMLSLFYSLSSIGLNTCDGEGWGLWNLTHMSYGIPQIVPDLPCFRKYMNEENGTLIESDISYYVNSQDGGEAHIVNPVKVADALYKYITDSSLYNKHVENIVCDTSSFDWNSTARQLFADL